MSDYDFTFDLSMTYTQADFDAITDEEFEKTTEVFLYNRKGEEFHFIKPKVGEWIEKSVMWCDDPAFECSICGEEIELIEGTPKSHGMNYCPNCGAKMERSK